MRPIVFLFFLLSFTRCTDVVKPGKTTYLHVAATSISQADREIAAKFARQTGTKVHLFKIGADSLLKHISSNRYNSGFDILLTEDQRLVYALSQRKLLAQIEDIRPFTKQNRQFNNMGHHWLAVAHNPLVVSGVKDSTGNCQYWNPGDSSQSLKLSGIRTTLYPDLKQNEKPVVNSRFVLTMLSRLVESDTLQQLGCWSYLQANKKYQSSFLSISEYAYARNHVAAQQFIVYYYSCRGYVAGARHYQPTSREGWAESYLQPLKIRRNQRFDR